MKPSWLILSFVYVSLLLHAGLYIADKDAASTSLVLLVGGIALVSALVFGFTAWLNAQRLERLRRQLRDLHTIYVLAAFGGLVGFGIYMRPEPFYAHSALALTAGVGLFYHTVYGEPEPPRPAQWVLMGLALVFGVILVIRGLTLSYVPAMDITDEPWILGWALGFVQTGTLSDVIVYGGGYDIQSVYVLVGIWMGLVGENLWAGRLFMLLWSLLLILLTAAAARNFYGSTAAILTACALMGSSILLIGARLRHDIFLGVAIAAALYFYSVAVQQQRPLLHGLAGFMIGLGWFGHYHALVFGPVLALGLYLPGYIRRLRRGQFMPEGGFWFFVAGGLMAAGIVFVVQVVPQLDGASGRAPRVPASAAYALRNILNHIENIARASQWEALLIGAGVVMALWRRRSIDISLLLILVLAHIALGILAARATDYYIVPLTPIYGLLVGSLIAHILGQIDQPHIRGQTLILGLLLLAVGLGQTTPLRVLLQMHPLHMPPPPAVQWVREYVEPGAVIVSEQYYYLWLHDNYHFYAAGSPSLMRASQRDQYASAAEMWDEADVDVFILDPNLATYGIIEHLGGAAFFAPRGYERVQSLPGPQAPVEIYMRPGQARGWAKPVDTALMARGLNIYRANYCGAGDQAP